MTTVVQTPRTSAAASIRMSKRSVSWSRPMRMCSLLDILRCPPRLTGAGFFVPRAASASASFVPPFGDPSFDCRIRKPSAQKEEEMQALRLHSISLKSAPRRISILLVARRAQTALTECQHARRGNAAADFLKQGQTTSRTLYVGPVPPRSQKVTIKVLREAQQSPL